MPESQIKQATLRDVADAAGVSYQTVWRVVNDHPHVATETRQRVKKAIRELDYRPHRAAQVLTTGRSYMVQLVIFEGGYGDPLPAVLHWAWEKGYKMVVTELKEPNSADAVRATLSEMSQMVDGVLMVMPYPHLTYDELYTLCQGRPFVLVSTQLGSHMPSVVYDQWNGARQAAEHLVGLGHRQIAEIGGPPDNFDAEMRHAAWFRVLDDHGLTLGPCASGNFEVCSGYRAAQKVLETGEPFTAILAANDLMALGAVRALHDAGLRVPEDVSVVGFDDIEEAAYFDPPLTTVHQDFEVLGQESVEYLISLIENEAIPVQQRVLYPQLVVRQSTAPVSSAG
jgi:LacI family transcriptional regulator